MHKFNYIIAIGISLVHNLFLCVILLDFYCTSGYGPFILETFVCKFASYSLVSYMNDLLCCLNVMKSLIFLIFNYVVLGTNHPANKS